MHPWCAHSPHASAKTPAALPPSRPARRQPGFGAGSSSPRLNWSATAGAACLALLVACALPTRARAGDVTLKADLAYKDGAALTAGEAERCRVDLYLPAEGAGFASILWLHGGGLTGGRKDSAVNQRLARRLAGAGIAVAMAEYRLNPAVTFPAYVSDAAAAFAWLRSHIAGCGGHPDRVFLGGHSAGAYLALMVALDERYLAACGLDQTSLAGVIALSGQTTTHFTVRAERRPGDERIVIDDAAPLYHVTNRPFPFMILYAGDDMAMRADENRLLASALRHAGCSLVVEHLYEDRDHGTIVSRMGEANDAVAADVIRFLRASPREAKGN